MRDGSPRLRKVKEDRIDGVRGTTNESKLLFDWKMRVVSGRR
jgi:hypothetical protein